LGRIIQWLIDPNRGGLRKPPRDSQALIIAASNSWLIAYDNLSRISEDLSDDLCRLSTEGGMGFRELFTDEGEKIFAASRPLLFTCIEDLVTRGDLLDRVIALELERIDEEDRRTEEDLKDQFEKATPRILGALLDAVAGGLRLLPTVRLDRLPRMADFARWAEACGRALGWKKNEFLDAYNANRSEANEHVLDDSLVACVLFKLVDQWNGQPWEGTSKELRELLDDAAGEKTCKEKLWPKTPKGVSNALRRLKPNLRRAGVDVNFPPREARTGRRLIQIIDRRDEVTPENACNGPSPPSPPSPDSPKSQNDNDLRGAGPSGEYRHPPSPTVTRPSPEGPAFSGCELITDTVGLDMVRGAIDGSPTVYLDTETTSLNPRTDRIRLLQLGCLNVEGAVVVYVVDCFHVNLLPLFEALGEKPLVIHNAAFDLGFLWALGFVPSAPITCTMILSRLLYGTRHPEGFHGLDQVVKRELDLDLSKQQQKSDWSGRLSREQLQYAVRDAYILHPLHTALRKKISEAGLDATAEAESRCLPAMAWLSSSGVGFDRSAWETLAKDAQQRQAELAERMSGIAPEVPGHLPGVKGWKWGSPDQVKEVFTLLGVNLGTTDDESLAAVNHPLADLLRKWRSAQRLATTYGTKWLKHVSDDGRVYAGWNQLGSDAGRMTGKNPNLQQIPADPRYRACFVAPPGRVLVKTDYSQIELRIACKIAGDMVLLEAYRRGDDLHTKTARAVLGKDEVTKSDRQLAKALNFGLIYGMGAEGFRAYAKSQYGLDLTPDQARKYRDAFFKSYPALAAWHAKVRSEHAAETRTLLGRRRLLGPKEPDTERLNSPVQGTGADGLKLALGLLWERRTEAPGAFPLLVVHDEIVVECDEAWAPAVEAWLRKAMVDAMAPLIDPVPVEVETRTGKAWGG
jgi:DNA polymerase-1